MSAGPTFSTNDLRSQAQNTKRAANRKHKWALGSVERVGRGVGNPRPGRASETYVKSPTLLLISPFITDSSVSSEYNAKRRETKSAVASLAHGARMARKHDVLEGTDTSANEDSSAGSGSDLDDGIPLPPSDAGVMYSFDAKRGPSHGSQILTAAMAKAVERFEEKETARIVSAEYDVLDSEGEVVAVTPVKKSKGKGKVEKAGVPDADEDYEFV